MSLIEVEPKRPVAKAVEIIQEDGFLIFLEGACTCSKCGRVYLGSMQHQCDPREESSWGFNKVIIKILARQENAWKAWSDVRWSKSESTWPEVW